MVRGQQQGATMAGWFFFLVGVTGLVASTVITIQGEQPVVARVLSSKALPDDESRVITRVKLPDGNIGVIESRDSFPTSSALVVLSTGDHNEYEPYSPWDKWVGSGVAFGAGAFLITVSRGTRTPRPAEEGR